MENEGDRELPDTHVLEKNNKLAFIWNNGLGMATVEESSMAHQKMREITTLSCNKNLTKQAYSVVQCCQLGRITLEKDETKHQSILEKPKTQQKLQKLAHQKFCIFNLKI